MGEAMTPIFLKFTDAQEAFDVLTSVGVSEFEGILSTNGPDYCIDILFGNGVIYKQTGEDELTAPIPGYHINAMWADPIPSALAPYMTAPRNPVCVFAS
jgi:hypothetical protein